jgi:hypothetical protein
LTVVAVANFASNMIYSDSLCSEKNLVVFIVGLIDSARKKSQDSPDKQYEYS